ncbi:hypothetical protein PVAP13_1KG200115 [Panicum virgatum]|uniref:Uncharacterized protein n=1 Tax=Panicum virgatum TaxID=38727 RepID=A0A8T0XQC3_PANVG|nr:hypothetical protein PVAP13_1KG200115 [Panicum virgatum]
MRSPRHSAPRRQLPASTRRRVRSPPPLAAGTAGHPEPTPLPAPERRDAAAARAEQGGREEEPAEEEVASPAMRHNTASRSLTSTTLPSCHPHGRKDGADQNRESTTHQPRLHLRPTAQLDEEKRKRQEIEERLEQERKLREEQEQMVAEEQQRMMNAERQRYEAWQQQM